MTPEEIRQHYYYFSLAVRALSEEMTSEEFALIRKAAHTFAVRHKIFAPSRENWPETQDEKWDALL